ncbi:hypothetical protein SDRG_10021 [Saprolegnia diclina VS20]|uniref:Uncharacterized protein n=1 Tax=Saprolegnia diclina (strain VS20) TaxID=1156394 RepID=T0RIS7_SAPDV|nr:hypothetical protein SDRG_10021 [Saprolegnia diclina VS20]EQC32273.1 hypothetical protein SDRG_10021 [Saprolegnia diclina VS20]|eukprot:XP_008614214.1 hypothetical protein SDRG_10021 [Saprolegnia diclina VS20]
MAWLTGGAPAPASAPRCSWRKSSTTNKKPASTLKTSVPPPPKTLGSTTDRYSMLSRAEELTYHIHQAEKLEELYQYATDASTAIVPARRVVAVPTESGSAFHIFNSSAKSSSAKTTMMSCEYDADAYRPTFASEPSRPTFAAEHYRPTFASEPRPTFHEGHGSLQARQSLPTEMRLPQPFVLYDELTASTYSTPSAATDYSLEDSYASEFEF